MRIALVHDWLTGTRGGERVLEAFVRLYPSADILALVHVPGSVAPEIEERVRQVSWLSRLPGVGAYYRLMLPFFPSAAASLDLTGYDLVISLSHAAAKNVRVPPGVRHICYCFTPMRYIWDQVSAYLGPVRFLAWPLVRKLRRWDTQGAERVDNFVAISKFVAARIRLFYGRSAAVVYPPVETKKILSTPPAVPFTGVKPFVFAGALVPYKRPDLVVEAFNKLGLPLVVIGSGGMEDKLRRKAGRNVRFLSGLSDPEMVAMFRSARALVFPGIEDFGLIPVEIMACGRPVIGAGRGGVPESAELVKVGQPIDPARHTGVEIPEDRANDVENVIAAVNWFMEHEQEFHPETCRQRSENFSEDSFRQSWRAFCSTVGIPAYSGDSISAAARIVGSGTARLVHTKPRSPQ